MMFSLFLKSLLGAAAVLLISLVSTRYVYLAGLVPLFPTFALIAHVLVASERGAVALRETALFGLASGPIRLVFADSISAGRKAVYPGC
jgi:membrane protein GlpM